MTSGPDLRLVGVALLAVLVLSLASQPAAARQTNAIVGSYVFEPVKPAPPNPPQAQAQQMQQAQQPVAVTKGSYQFRPFPAPSAAGDDGAKDQWSEGIYALKGGYYYSYAENAWRIVTGPVRYDKDDWLNVAIVAGVTGGLIALDEVIRDFAQDDVRSSTSDDISSVFYQIGDTHNLVLTGIGSYALFELLDMKREKGTALLALESLILAALLTEGIKSVTGRERPNKTDDALDFTGFAYGENTSFPSGHATNGFAVASVISEVYGDENPWVPWLSYGVATGVSLSRINDNKHWASDAFLGSALGYFIGKMVVRYNPFLEEQGLALQPFSVDGTQGVAMSMKF